LESLQSSTAIGCGKAASMQTLVRFSQRFSTALAVWTTLLCRNAYCRLNYDTS